MRRESRQCACVVSWMIDLCDGRGPRPATPINAAWASGQGIPVTLEQRSTAPLRPITPLPRVQYAGANSYINQVCDICGYPTETAVAESEARDE